MKTNTREYKQWKAIVPEPWLRNAYWAYGTPHLTQFSAMVHLRCTNKVDDMEGFSLAVKALKGTNGLEDVLEFYKSIDYDWGFAVETITNIPHGARVRLENLRDRLLKNKLEMHSDPTFGTDQEGLAKLQDMLNRSLDWIKSLEKYSPNLANFEDAMAHKYAATQSIRTASEYASIARANYSPDRPGWKSMARPSLSKYDEALRVHYRFIFDDELAPYSENTAFDPTAYQDLQAPDNYSDAMNSTQRNTYGGSPYYITMDEFVLPEPPVDGSEDLKYVKLYDFNSMVYYLLPPRFKRMIPFYYQYSPLERIQHGKLLTNDVFGEFTKTKQRIIQAESAVISHATKQMHDIMMEQWLQHPITAADKISEESVTKAMIEIAEAGFKLNDRVHTWLCGCDYFNYDATQNAILLNDAYFNVVRMKCPSWYNYWIVDPYFINSQFTPTWIPTLGLIRTTGIKSGQQVTNQADSFVANFSDSFELVTCDSWRSLTIGQRVQYLLYRMINGDDRYKLAPFGASHIESADLRLGLISQKQKQEIFDYRSDNKKDMKVTYLKTILYYDLSSGSFNRSSAESAAVLGRYTPERVKRYPAPARTVVDSIMAGTRLQSHPDLTLLKHFISQFDIGSDWLKGRISTDVLLAHAAAEELNEYRAIKGKKWLDRAGFNIDDALQKLYGRYGMVPGSYNFQASYAGDDGKLAFNKIPIVQRLLEGRES